MRVLRLLVRGLSYSGSAKALCVEPSTVKYHVINMLQKTGLENKLQPAIAASEAKPVVELAERRLSSLYRQGDCENRPMPISRFSCNGAAMQQSNLPYKRKPKAYAAHLPASGFIYPEKGWNTLVRYSSGMPQPVSATRSTALLFFCRIVICTEPPGVLYLMPFSTKLKNRR